MTEKTQDPRPIELLDPMSLDEPWRSLVWHWLLHHPTHVFLPELDSPGEYRLSWDDLRDILVAASVIPSAMTVS